MSPLSKVLTATLIFLVPHKNTTTLVTVIDTEPICICCSDEGCNNPANGLPVSTSSTTWGEGFPS